MIWLFCLVVVPTIVACQEAPPASRANVRLPAGASQVRLYVEPEAGVGPVVQFIGQSQQTLDVAMYLLSDRRIVRSLEEARRRGVRVRVLLEEHPYGTGPGNGAIYRTLRGGGVAVTWAPAGFQFNHAKYAVADAEQALVGTANWSYSAFQNNREYLILDRDPEDVRALTALFAADWNRQSVTLTDERLVVSPLNSRRDLQALVDAAQKEVDLEAEEPQDTQMVATLLAAARRGVTVRVVTVARSGSSADARGRAELARGGVGVRALSHPYMHAKDLIVDRHEAYVGSENLSAPSLDKNREVGLLIDDASAVRTLEDTFDRDWQSAR